MALAQADRLLNHLPAIYREDPFLLKYLAPFEELLLGSTDVQGLEETIAGISRFFDPTAAPSESLDWLSSWVALKLFEEFDDIRKRDFISRAVSTFKWRGTRKALETALQIYTRLAPAITEFHDPAKPAEFRPHYFHVLLRISESDPAKRKRYVEVASAIIEVEKPAHTYYDLQVETPAMQIAVHSTIGVDTLLSLPA